MLSAMRSTVTHIQRGKANQCISKNFTSLLRANTQQTWNLIYYPLLQRFVQERLCIYYIYIYIDHTIQQFKLLCRLQRACDEDSCRLDFWLLDLKHSAEFYLANGAVDMTECEEWNMYRLFEITKKPAWITMCNYYYLFVYIHLWFSSICILCL